MKEPRYKNREGKAVPSVTEILSEQVGWGHEQLQGWRDYVRREGGDPDVLSQHAMQRGTALHKQIEDYFHGREQSFDDMDLKARPAFEKWREYMETMCGDVAIYAIEKPFIVDEPETGVQFAGTIDAVLEINEVKTLVDWKTTSSKSGYGVREKYFLQLGAYALAYNLCERQLAEEENRMPSCIQQARIVVVNFETIEVYDHQVPSTLLDASSLAFLDVLRLHKFQQRLKGK